LLDVTTTNSPFPFKIRGGTDFILVEQTFIDNRVHKAGILATIELKKVEDHHRFQAISETVAADFMVNYDINVIGVLTNLNKVWQIFWLGEGKKINMITLSHRKKALDIIGNMVSMKRVAGLTVQHTKVRDYVVVTSDDINDDIAPMEVP